MELNNVLFFDTETIPQDNKPISFQWLLGDEKGIITEFTPTTYAFIKSMWDKADACIAHNALFDMGVLSAMYNENTWKWINPKKGEGAIFTLFGHQYKTVRVAYGKNIIKSRKCDIKSSQQKYAAGVTDIFGRTTRQKRGKKYVYRKATPVIDSHKLWMLLVDDKITALKGKLKNGVWKPGIADRYLGHSQDQIISYSPENAVRADYQLQDVIFLKELFKELLKKISLIPFLNDWAWSEFEQVVTQATFTKIEYSKEYPDLSKWKEDNTTQVDKFTGLKNGIEKALHGGITLAHYRGKLPYTGWVDIKGAYTKAIETMNTDSYLHFSVKQLKANKNGVFRGYKKDNVMVRVLTNFVMQTIDKSLKLYILHKTPTLEWMWYNDVLACSYLYNNHKYKVVEAYEFIPLNNTPQSLPLTWTELKSVEEKREQAEWDRLKTPKNDRVHSTLRGFYKFMSNTSYGIKAQRDPFETKHTNLIIAGMITSKAHAILCQIIHVLKQHAYDNLYNDTDSCCFHHHEEFNEDNMKELVNHINDVISPFEVSSEGFGFQTTILSLKRYVSVGGTEKDKVCVHGKGRYNVNQDDIKELVLHKKMPGKDLVVSNLAANTPIGFNQIIKSRDEMGVSNDYCFPYMFITDVPVTTNTMSGFLTKWYKHFDNKTTAPKKDPSTISSNMCFTREFKSFKNQHKATAHFNAFPKSKQGDWGVENNRNWDKEIFEDFLQP